MRRMFNGERIKQARELRKITQTELAKKINRSQSTIARIERGEVPPSSDIIEAVAIQTGFPPSFFRRRTTASFPVGSLQFRARRMGSNDRTQAYQYAKTLWEVADQLQQKVAPIPLRLPELDEPPELAAEITRSEFGLSPDKPVRNVIYALERSGVLVLTIPLALKKWDAFCCWVGDKNDIPVIAVADKAPGDRLRYSVAHELGHLVLHRSLSGNLKEIDRQANQFAAAFLMPETTIREELLSPITLSSLAELKPRWGVSIQALVRRAYSLNVITERHYKSLSIQISSKGWRKAEPGYLDIPVERPRAFRKMAELIYGDPIDYKRLASDLGLSHVFAKQIVELHASKSDMIRRKSSGQTGKAQVVNIREGT